MSHTPGPWAVRGGNSELPQVWDSGFNACITDRVFNGNAALIAAAPDLLAACKAALPYVDYLADNGNEDADATARQLEAAIAKAEGR